MVDTVPAPAAEAAAELRLGEVLADLRRYLAPERGRLLAAGLLLLLSGAVGLAQPLVVRQLLGGATPLRHAAGPVAALIVLVVVGAVGSAYGNYQLTTAAEGTVLTARRLLTAHVLRLPMAAFRRATPGDLMARVTGDTTLLRQVVQLTLVQAATGLVTAAGALVLMATLDPVLLGVSLLAILLLLGTVGLILPRIRAASIGAQNSIGDLGTVLDRSLTAFTTVKASGTEEAEAARIRAAAEQAYRHGVVRARWDSTANAVAMLAVQLVFLVVLGVGALRISAGAIQVATLVAFLLYVLFLAGPVMSLVAVFAFAQTGRAVLQRIGEITRLPPEPARSPLPLPEPVASAAAGATVVFDRVSFRYPRSAEPVLREFSLTVPAVGLTALVGPSGGGKSTALNLIERFWDPEAGSILVDGTEVRDWDLHRLRGAIGYVEQDAPVLAGTLRENLAYAVDHATEAELREVVALARLDGLLERLGGDLDAPVQYRGVSLSGGERQRIAIARALLRRPRLLLLDEATSQLDAANEAALRAVVQELAARMPVLAVAHRLSTVLGATTIAVVESGTVRAVGSHHELLCTDPVYAHLAAHQLLADDPNSREFATP
ncbi:ABC transporter ATP-binding protein [Kitasatospora sp. MMS16-BH015]|uniref:ABC transporter ATP-binding protein n=1 Tax=Kitasatospora sp. MMS16-BH015 TaxID=2018025 RepID=UPI000CA312DA|nr:ABC transporter ATP-binding protein [Kitasatospora sp. MMS16-BH015]AUG80276.1 ABC transporter ATP-binding protein [Kitasatospora sp. MMS16-BH015]